MSSSLLPAMHRLLLALGLLACPSHGQPVKRLLDEQLLSSPRDDESRSPDLKVLASLLLASSSEAAFNPTGVGVRAVMHNPKLTRSHEHFGQRPPVMSDFYLTPPDDPSIPQKGMAVPDRDTILRGCKVTRVDESGAWVEVDPKSGLNGFIYPMGLDNAYVKNLEDTFKVGDLLDAKVIEVSGISGRLLLSRKILMDEEGWEKHELPMDGRARPKRDTSIPSRKEKERSAIGWGDPDDPCTPRKGAVVPEDGVILRDLPVTRVTRDGVWCMVDEKQNLQGFIFPMGVDSAYIKNLDKTIKVGDKLDARSMGVSGISGRLLLSRKQLMDKEGWEKHELPEDGRERPMRRT